jgi:DNA-binding Lrp family transcriptional regulator
MMRGGQDSGAGDRLPREAAVRRLMALDGEGRLTTGDVLLAAEGLAVSQRTVWRWIEQRARNNDDLNQVARDHFMVTDLLRERLAFWRGNISAVHRELVEEAKSAGTAGVSRQTLQRAVERDLLRGDRAGLPSVEHEPAEPALCSPIHFDNADWNIIEALRDDRRESFQAVSDRLGMNESSVRRRFERLQNSGCIDILTIMPSAALGMGAETLITVKVAPGSMEAVAQQLAHQPAVRYLAATLHENSLFCEIILPSTSEIYNFITSTLSRLDGVKGWTASMELLFLKRAFIETPWWPSQVSHLAAG